MTFWHIGPGSCASELGLKVFCRLKVNWKDFLQKFFAIHFTCSESCALSKVNCKQRKSIGTQNKWIGTSTYGSSNWFSLVAIDFTQSTWFTISKVNWKIFLNFCWKFFQFTFSLQNTLVICTWSGPLVQTRPTCQQAGHPQILTYKT